MSKKWVGLSEIFVAWIFLGVFGFLKWQALSCFAISGVFEKISQEIKIEVQSNNLFFCTPKDLSRDQNPDQLEMLYRWLWVKDRVIMVEVHLVKFMTDRK